MKALMVRRTGGVAAAVAACLGLQAPSVWAQAADQADELDEVMVTGSRLGATGYTTPTPVTQLDAEALEQLNVVNIGKAVNELPAFKATTTPTNNGWGSFNVGAQIVNLRGLGVNRNLVLVDGRRFAPVTREGTVDLNLVPSGLIARTDVVTGGASAAYGSDAIAGAVNVVLDKSLSGLKGQLDYGLSGEGDGGNLHASLAGGADFAGGRGHFILGGEYEKQEGIGDCFTRDWCKGGQIVTNTGAGAVAGLTYLVRSDVGGGFPTNPGGVISKLNNNTAATLAIRNLRGTGAITFDAAGNVAAYNLGSPASGNSAIGGDSYSGMKTTQLMVPVDRYSTFGHADFEFSDTLSGFIEGSYGHVEGSTLQSRYFGAPVVVFNDNPYIPAEIRALLPPASATPSTTRPANSAAAFNLAVLGQRRGESASEASTWRITFGLEGRWSDTWSWDSYYQYAHTDRDQQVENNMVVGASRVINRPGSGGVNNPASFAFWTWANDPVFHPADALLPEAQRRIVCRASISADPALAAAAAGCVPFNPFGEGRATKAALDYVYRTLTEAIDIDQHVVAANVRGRLADLWAGPLSVAAGLEYRRDSTALVHDTLSNSFAYFQNFGADYTADQDVWEGYFEGELPLLKDMPLAQNAVLNAAVRRTQYETSGVGGFNQSASSNEIDATTWKVGLVWDVNDWMRLRVTRSRDIRAPNFNELFQASASTFTAVTNRWAANASQFPVGLSGGNPQLDAESARTTTIGMVLQPQWDHAGRLRLSADYYDIRVNGYIGTPGGAQNIVDRCFNYSDPLTCPLIVFAPDASGNAKGILSEIRNVNVNLQWLRSRGLDLEADYRLPMDALREGAAGSLSLRLLATRTFDNSTNLFGQVTDQVGVTGTGGGIADWLVNLYTTYANGPFSATLTTRYIPSGLYSPSYIGPDDPRFATLASTSTQVTLDGRLLSPINDNTVAGAVYFNLNGSYTFHEGDGRRLQGFASISNLLDKTPPAAPSTQYPTNPVYFDQIGRYFRVGVRFSY
ncbi:MAG: Colicin receptor precursor [Pseudomonadota bacterium]